MFYVPVRDGVKLAVYDLNPTGGETVFFVHGWPLSHKIFEYQENLLVQCGYRVVSMDLRGFGASDTPACGYSYDRLADDIYTVVRKLCLPPFTLVGFSMGGAIALRYMARHHGFGVKKLALLGAAAPSFTKRPGFPYGVTRESVNELIEQARTDRAQLSTDFSNRLLACPHSEAIKKWFRDISLGASGIATIATGCSLRDEDGRGDLKKAHVPTGVFHGKKDEIVPFELALVQEEAICGSVLFPFENSGHGIFYDELELFNQRFLEFLKGRFS